jgi:hypothetical protein
MHDICNSPQAGINSDFNKIEIVLTDADSDPSLAKISSSSLLSSNINRNCNSALSRNNCTDIIIYMYTAPPHPHDVYPCQRFSTGNTLEDNNP